MGDATVFLPEGELHRLVCRVGRLLPVNTFWNSWATPMAITRFLSSCGAGSYPPAARHGETLDKGGGRLLRIDTAQRRARLVTRHHLSGTAGHVVAAARALIGFHATDPAGVYVAAWARVAGLAHTDLEKALYQERSLARILAMRRTMFVTPTDQVPLFHAACTRALAARERARTVKMLEDGGLTDDGEAWLQPVVAATLEALTARGEATAVELSADVPLLREKIPVGAGTRWEGEIGVSTRVLFLLANEGRVVRGRPRGSWVSSQYRWAPLEPWLGVDVDALPAEPARVELARRWLARFGPATVADLKWWSGWTLMQTRTALAALDLVDVDLDGAAGIVLAKDTDPVQAPAPAAALLPALDATVMGWKQRDWYLGDHGPALFDRNGNAGPTIWWDGRVVGGWSQRPDGTVVFRLLDDIGNEATARVKDTADALTAWVAGVRVIPRFRTPLERDLS